MNLLRTYSYSKVDEEDPDEVKHRKAQFLIYKTLEKADSRKRSLPRLGTSKIKIKFVARLRRVRKSVHFTISVVRAKVCVHKKILVQLRLWKQAICDKDADVVMALTPLFA